MFFSAVRPAFARLGAVAAFLALVSVLVIPALAQVEAPSVTVVASDASATEAGATPGELTFTRTGDLDETLLVSYLVGGTATAGTDYAALSGTVTFAADASTATVSVTPVDDALVEGDETVVVTLVAGAGYVLGASTSATVTIVDNDAVGDPTLPDLDEMTKDDCKKGGWEDFGVFKNQGDCVSWVATGGRNAPALLGSTSSDSDSEDSRRGGKGKGKKPGNS